MAARFNANKPQLSYILDFPHGNEQLARVMEFGAKKYARDNWKKGQSKQTVLDSLLRHLTAYANGEEKDKDSGLSHTGHILANAYFLAEYEATGTWVVENKAPELHPRATVKEKCPKCGHPEMSFYTMQMRSVDEGQTVFFECLKCG